MPANLPGAGPLPAGTAERLRNYRDMPRFYFHLDDGQRIEDYSGSELPDVDEAKHIAGMIARKFAQTDVANRTPSKWFIIVTDEDGDVVHRAYPDH